MLIVLVLYFGIVLCIMGENIWILLLALLETGIFLREERRFVFKIDDGK